MKTKAAAWVFIGVLAGTFGGLVMVAQQSKTITLTWDGYNPLTDGAWQAVRIYDISVTPELLVATAPCQAGPPITCPTQVSFTMSKAAHTYVARSFDGNWESDNSNAVVIPGPPQGPKNLRKQ